jgi:hypothetical protein
MYQKFVTYAKYIRDGCCCLLRATTCLLLGRSDQAERQQDEARCGEVGITRSGVSCKVSASPRIL